jgi:quercetin dioxygenase-like cupin family protein
MTGGAAPGGPVHDLGQVPTGGASGVVWSLPGGEDLNVNVVRLAPGAVVEAHRNDEVDVVVHVRSGEGEITVEQRRHALGPDCVVLIERGATRSIRAGGQGLTYLTVHRRRGPLGVGRPRRSGTGG